MHATAIARPAERLRHAEGSSRSVVTGGGLSGMGGDRLAGRSAEIT
jgi:hypothetical protein